MCGIAGFNFRDRVLLQKMVEKLSHRGPDEKGYFLDDVSLGHSRLSIIDLQSGKQPMYNEDASMCIVFNGEIFNYKELREKLPKHNFATESDTEVILHGYEEWGIDVLNKLNGQFAFCIYDGESMFLARDRLGIKPLYFYVEGKKFIFASEMKAILEHEIPKKVDETVISDYFSYNYVPAPKTIFKNMYKLLPGHYLLFKDKKIKIRKYWDLKFQPSNISLHDAEKQIIEKLKESVKKRMIADVPLGAFLSGGIDSSAIVALMSQLTDNVKTFSIGFGEGDELSLARKTARMHSTDHKEFIIKPGDFNLFKDLVYYADEPFADSSIIPTYMVSKIARKYVKVALSGDGGDENFAGYNRYVKNKYERLYSKIPVFNERFNRIREISKIKDDSLRFIKGNEVFIDSEKKQLLNSTNESFKMNYLTDGERLNRLLYLDIKTTLPNDYLKKVDTASMANSLEVRTPFLDHEFMEFNATLPPEYKLKGTNKKYILKRAVKGLIPNEVIEGKKQGFSIPIDDWLRNDLKDELHEILMSSAKRGYFNKFYLHKLWVQHQNNIFNHRERLWSIISFEMWHRRFMD